MPSNIDAVFDSGSTYTYVPSKDYAILIKQLVRTTDVNCTKLAATGLTYCNCTRVSDPKFANMTLKLGNRYLLYMNSTEYLTWDATRKQCLMTILEDGDNSLKHWILGAPFLRGYYAIHDM
jgi:Eukaryotic aspartyl protease